MNQSVTTDRPADVNINAGDNANANASNGVKQIHADHATVKRLGNWTRADRYEIRARSGSVVLDLRSPDMPAEVEIRLQLDHSAVKLLLPDEATVEHWDLAWTGRGKVKDAQAARPEPRTAGGLTGGLTDGLAGGRVELEAGGVRHVRLLGSAAGSEVRINRGGVAVLAAMCSREYVEELRQARREGTYPTIDDPTRAPKAAA